MKSWLVAVSVVAAATAAVAASGPAQQAERQPSVAAVRALAAGGKVDEAWAMLDRLPVQMTTVSAAVELALAPKTPLVAASRLPFLADRTARLSLSNVGDRRLIACAVVARLSSDAACAEQVNATTLGRAGTALDRARLWVTRRLLGEQPPALPNGWESDVRGSSALEPATWPELPPATRVRLIEPLVTSQMLGDVIAALATLQTIPGPEALAVWHRLAAPGGPSYPGARTQILVGLARHGDAESVKALAPYLAQLSDSDRLVLAQGRAERGDAGARAELMDVLNTGLEHQAVRAAETLAALGGGASVDLRVRRWVRESSGALRERWLAVAARLNLGATPEIIQCLTSEDEGVRLAGAVAVAAAAAHGAPKAIK